MSSRWITNTKVDDTQIKVEVPAYKGRTSRIDSRGVVAQTAGGVQGVVPVNQSGVSEYIGYVSATPLYLPNTSHIVSGETPAQDRGVDLQFASNAASITAEVTAGSSWLSIAGFKVNDHDETLGQPITGDPGASDEYIGGLILSYDANTGSARNATIRITTPDGQWVEYEIIQYGADSAITLTPNVLSFTNKGGTQYITVTATDDWNLV